MSSNFNNLETWSGYGTTSGWTTKYYDVQGLYKYQSTAPFTLNNIYILTREAAVINSLLVNFNVNFATASVYHLELEFDSLDLQYFNIQSGDQIPCYLSGLSSASGITDGPVCFGYSSGINDNQPLIVRIVNFAGFSAGTNIKLALDNFNNPPTQNLFAVPINLRMRLKDLSNTKSYTSYFPHIYFSDSLNVRNTVSSTGSFSANSGYLGASTYLQWTVGWPYNSGTAIWDKLVLKIDGGVTCCRAFSSLDHLTDNYMTYTVLWANTKANTTVYDMPARNSGTSTTFRINNVINPQPVNHATYEQGKKVTISWYSVYKTYNIYTLTQPNYSAYSKNSDFQTGTASYVSNTRPNHFYSHQYYPLTY